MIPIEGGGNVLRLEDLVVTNGPDLYVYLSTDKSASDFVNLGKLKGNIRNQNYQIPEGTDMNKYIINIYFFNFALVSIFTLTLPSFS